MKTRPREIDFSEQHQPTHNMNKILNINLGGYALTIDDDAYEFLSAYIDQIRNRFSESDGRDEIVHDIEMRLGELISNSMGTRSIVMLPDVQAAVQVMGQPEDFGGESDQTQTRTKTKGSSRQSAIRTGKRLFRDEEDVVVAGICSGLSAYVGINDPVWMRLIFVLLTFLSAGFWVPAYLLLWILVPPARTAADRLAMRGEPVNVDNIAREIEEGFERLGHHVNELGNDVKKKANGSGGNAALSAGVTAIGQIFATVLRFLARFGVIIGIVIAISVFISFALVWIVSIFSVVSAAPYLDYFTPYSIGTTWIGLTNLFFLLSIPLLGLCLAFARVLFRVRGPGWLGPLLGIFWTINLFSAFTLGAIGAKEFWQSGYDKKRIDLSSIQSDTLRIDALQIANDEYDNGFHWWGFHGKGVNINDDHLEINGLSSILIKVAHGSQFEATQVVRARGRTILAAEEHAATVVFNPEVQGKVLKIPTSYTIANGKKWRVQEVKMEIGIPVGKYVVLSEHINFYARCSDYPDRDEGPYLEEYPNQLFKMTEKGLVCVDCPKLGDRRYRGNRDYENFILEGNFDAEIRQGDDFNFEITGNESDKNKIQVIQTGDKITFSSNGENLTGKIKVVLEAPNFTSLISNGNGLIVIRGFDENSAQITSKGGNTIKAYLDANDLTLILSEKTHLDLTGKGESLDLSITDGASLDAGTWNAKRASVSASNGAVARLYAEENAEVKADATSTVKIDGKGTVNYQGR